MTRSVRSPIVEHVRRRGARPTQPPSMPLPPAVLAALGAIVRDMRDLPRDCIRDPAELVLWLRRMAGRVEGVGRMRVPGALPSSARAPALPAFRSAAQRDPAAHPVNAPASPLNASGPPVNASVSAVALAGAEAVLGRAPAPSSTPVVRTIVGRRGRAVRVEVRRARVAGQMEMQL